jgi:hypothetical protein
MNVDKLLVNDAFLKFFPLIKKLKQACAYYLLFVYRHTTPPLNKLLLFVDNLLVKGAGL